MNPLLKWLPGICRRHGKRGPAASFRFASFKELPSYHRDFLPRKLDEAEATSREPPNDGGVDRSHCMLRIWALGIPSRTNAHRS